ncbi:MAG TPA: response regulator [Candidatus Sulfotelmatobacter sp.]|nr:response regulator [Candidatus Sulfotelmatobacter sp.]
MSAPRILVADDDRLTRWSLATQLGRLGYEVETVASARDCLAALEASPPALVLLDIMLPDLDGFTLLAKILSERPALPVLLMSAHTLHNNAVRARQEGAAGFLEKPCDPVLLHEAVAQALKKADCGESRSG